jgi:hypothetical protein
MFSDFQKGIIYGDGTIVNKATCKVLMFTCTNKSIVDNVHKWFDDEGIKVSRFQRNHTSEDKQNYEILDILESYHNPYIKGDLELSFIPNFEFLQGYIQTKGSIFKYMDKDVERYKMAFSGTKDNMETVRELLESIGIQDIKVIHRKEREHLGVISKSYRIQIHNRKVIRNILEQFNDDNWISLTMKEQVENFKLYDKETPYFRPNGAFKHYKNAVRYMLREMCKTESLATTRGGEFRIFYDEEGYPNWESLFNVVYNEFNEMYPRGTVMIIKETCTQILT